MNPADLRLLVRDIPDFPKPGVTFKDVTPLFADPACMTHMVDSIAAELGTVDKVVGIEARGFILAAPVAYKLRAGFIPLRKLGKLPWTTESESYALEYGEETLEIHADAIRSGERVAIVDDVLATGGTATAAARLVERLGGKVSAFGFLIDLSFLGGRAKLADYTVSSLLEY